MYMARVTLTATEEAPNQEIDPNLVTDLIWALARPEHSLEHLHTVTRPGRIDIIAFHLAADTPAAHNAGRRLCQLAITTSPQLSGWRISPPC